MTANEHNDYDGRFPEHFNWSLLDSRCLSQLACQLTMLINNELKQTPDRRANIPGLRVALRNLARIASL